MKIFIGSDHAGYLLKETLKNYLVQKEIEYKDLGTFSEESVNYPEFAYKVADGVSKDLAHLGILICGTGIGMSITANKIKNIRAAVVHNVETAKLSRLHNNANVLCLGARVLNEELALEILDVWLNTSFEGGRHENRINLITKLTGL